MSDEAGRGDRDETSLSHDARLDVVKLQTGVVARHLAWSRSVVKWTGDTETREKRTLSDTNTNGLNLRRSHFGRMNSLHE